MQANFKPYEGNKPYIFVSYSHKDSERVLPILNLMNAAGYRIWYDGGIPWTSKWPDVIAEHILGCGVCMAFHSSISVESEHCRREIHFAQSENKPILPAYLENVRKPVIKYELGLYQSVKLRDSKEIARFIADLGKQKFLQNCKRTVKSHGNQFQEITSMGSAHKPQPPHPSHKQFSFNVLNSALVILSALIFIAGIVMFLYANWITFTVYYEKLAEKIGFFIGTCIGWVIIILIAVGGFNIGGVIFLIWISFSVLGRTGGVGMICILTWIIVLGLAMKD